jgi:RimJ/RimL family protein N-acetyltransferase
MSDERRSGPLPATPVLETARLVLRPMTLEDAPAVQRRFGRWEIIRHLAVQVPWPYPPDGAERFISEVALPGMERGDRMVWAIAPREPPDDELIGSIDFRTDGGAHGNRGFWLAEPWQGRGYMTEAVTAVQDHLFFEVGIERIRVTNSKRNARSRRIKEKTGAVRVAEAEIAHHEGQVDSEVWEVTRERWAKIRGR